MTCILIKQGDLCCAASFVVMCCPDNDVTMAILTHPLPMVRKKTNGSILRWLTPVAITSDGRKLGNKMAAGLLLWRCDVVMWCVMSARDIRDNSGQAVTLWAATIQCSLISSGYCNVPLRIQLHLIAVKHSSSLIISPCLDLSFPSYTHFTL